MTGKALLPILSLAFVLAAGARLEADEKPAREYEVKAEFLFRFTQFVEWPEEAGSILGGDITIGVVGKDPFGDVLDAVVAARSGNGRSVSIRRFRRPQEMQPCHIVFVTREAAAELPAILKALSGAPVLLVGESEAFAESGGAVELFLENRRIRFKINARAAERAGLHINSRMLSLARLVDSEQRKEGN